MQTEQLIERYLDAWNETDADARRAAVADVYADGAQYVDPLADGGVDAHHNIARFSWELVPATGGESLAVGFDVAVLEDDGRIASVLGFLDKAPGA